MRRPEVRLSIRVSPEVAAVFRARAFGRGETLGEYFYRLLVTGDGADESLIEQNLREVREGRPISLDYGQYN